MSTQSENKLTKILSGKLATLIVFTSLFYTQYLIFLVVPDERIMGPVQRIFYFHVGAANACYLAIACLFISSLLTLNSPSQKTDLLAQASGEVALLFCSIVLFSGMIWGHAAWNTWFRWEPRLVSFLLTWLILLSYNLLRFFADAEKAQRHCAVLAILGAISVPITVFSIKLLPQFAQLHPQVVENRGLRDPSFLSTMFISMGVLCLFCIYLIALRYRLGILEFNREGKNGSNT